MSKGQWAFRPAALTRGIRAVTDAGLFVSRVRINPQGQIEIATAKEPAQDSKTDLDVWHGETGHISCAFDSKELTVTRHGWLEALPNHIGTRGKGAIKLRFPLLFAAAVILVGDPTGKWTGDPLQPWFESLRNKAGLFCCAKADGHPLDESQWDIKDNNYRVFLEGKWTVVPNDPNKFNKAVVWLQRPGELAWGGHTGTPILCFMPGSEV